MLGLETPCTRARRLWVTVERLFALMSWEAGGMPVSVIATAARGRRTQANLCVFDPNVEWIVRGDAMASKSRNTPFEGRAVRGRVRHTIFQGQPVVEDGAAQR